MKRVTAKFVVSNHDNALAYTSLFIRELLSKNYSDASATFVGHDHLRLFPVPEGEENHERTMFCDHRGDKNKIVERAAGYTKKCVSEVF